MISTRKLRSLKLALVSTFALGATMSGVNSYAASVTDNLGVGADVTDSCTIVATTAIAFGTYDYVVTNRSAPLNGTGTVTVTCTTGAAPVVTLGQGANAGVGSTDAAPIRRMLSGTDLLGYVLYSDTGRGTVWGNTALTGVVPTANGAAQALTVYGQIPAGQNVPTGTYADTVVATVTF